MSMICTKDSVSYGGVLSSFHDPSISQNNTKGNTCFFVSRQPPANYGCRDTFLRAQPLTPSFRYSRAVPYHSVAHKN